MLQQLHDQQQSPSLEPNNLDLQSHVRNVFVFLVIQKEYSRHSRCLHNPQQKHQYFDFVRHSTISIHLSTFRKSEFQKEPIFFFFVSSKTCETKTISPPQQLPINPKIISKNHFQKIISKNYFKNHFQKIIFKKLFQKIISKIKETLEVNDYKRIEKGKYQR
jgi:hypothetical protein